MSNARTWFFSSLLLAPGVWAGNAQLSYALAQAEAAHLSHQEQNYQEAGAHTRVALGHVEILRRQDGNDVHLAQAESDLQASLQQNDREAYSESARILALAIGSLEAFRGGASSE